MLPPLRTAQAAAGSWTQTEWTTPNSTLGVVSSGTNQYFRPSSVSSYGQLVGTFGVCAGAGDWCQGPGEAAGGQTLRLAGNHKSDAGNPYSSDLNSDGVSELLFANWWNGTTTVFNGGWIYWGQGAGGTDQPELERGPADQPAHPWRIQRHRRRFERRRTAGGDLRQLPQ